MAATDGAGGPRRRSPIAVVLFTVLGAIVPGAGLIAAGRVRSGVAVLVATVAVAIGLVLYVGTSTGDLLDRALDPATLRRGAVVAVVVAVAWSVVTIVSHRALRPVAAGTGERVGGSILVGVLCLAVSTPLVLGANVLLTSQQVLGTLVRVRPVTALGGGNVPGAPTDSASASASPGAASTARTVTPYSWERRRLNILLIGSDAGPDRAGTRTDSMVIASIDTVTGKVLLVSIPRNLCRLDWDPASALGRAYPDGWKVDDTGCVVGSNGDNLINAIYNDVPIEHPGAVGKTDYPGADALALALQYSLDLPIDYFLAVDLTAFKVLVNSIGGVTVNINEPLPVGGSHNGDGTVTYPTRWLMPGPDQHLAGNDALWYSRSRFTTNDYDRVDRQKCMVTAITHQANPLAILKHYPSLAAALESNVLTDIPRRLLSPLAQLALRVKASGATSSITVDSTNIPGMGGDTDPDWRAAAAAIAQALRKTDRVASTRAATSPSPTSPSPGATRAPGHGVTASASASSSPTGKTADGSIVTTDVAAGCTYDPAAASAATADWESHWGATYDARGQKR